MHTDEYEISIGREISMCRRRIRKLEKSILNFEKKYGMTTETYLSVCESGTNAIKNTDAVEWKSSSRELQFWKKMLKEYEEALKALQ